MPPNCTFESYALEHTSPAQQKDAPQSLPQNPLSCLIPPSQMRRTCPIPCRARWYTRVADVTVFPVPGGPWMRDSGRCRTAFTAVNCEWFSSGKPGAEKRGGSVTRRTCGSTSWPSNLYHSAFIIAGEDERRVVVRMALVMAGSPTVTKMGFCFG